MRPLPDLWGSAPERPSTISTGGSSQACAKLYACGTMSGTTSKRRPAVKSSPCLETAPRDPAALVVSNYRHYMLHIQDSKQARSAQCSLLGRSAGWKLERPGSPTCEEAPKLCLVLRTGWAACGTTSGTTSRRRPGAGTLAHGNRQHHNAEQGSIRAKKQQHECWWTWKQSSCPL